MISTNKVQDLVLTRKLTPSDKQRRKQLIAEASKIPQASSRNNKTSRIQNSSTPNKTWSCFGGKDESDPRVISKVEKIDNSTISSQNSSPDLMDSGFCSYLYSFLLCILFYHGNL